jgi:hypothetical protein
MNDGQYVLDRCTLDVCIGQMYDRHMYWTDTQRTYVPDRCMTDICTGQMKDKHIYWTDTQRTYVQDRCMTDIRLCAGQM